MILLRETELPGRSVPCDKRTGELNPEQRKRLQPPWQAAAVVDSYVTITRRGRASNRPPRVTPHCSMLPSILIEHAAPRKIREGVPGMRLESTLDEYPAKRSGGFGQVARR